MVWECYRLTSDFEPTPDGVTWFQLDIKVASESNLTFPGIQPCPKLTFDLVQFDLIKNRRVPFNIYDPGVVSIKACRGFGQMLSFFFFFFFFFFLQTTVEKRNQFFSPTMAGNTYICKNHNIVVICIGEPHRLCYKSKVKEKKQGSGKWTTNAWCQTEKWPVNLFLKYLFRQAKNKTKTNKQTPSLLHWQIECNCFHCVIHFVFSCCYVLIFVVLRMYGLIRFCI